MEIKPERNCHKALNTMNMNSKHFDLTYFIQNLMIFLKSEHVYTEKLTCHPRYEKKTCLDYKTRSHNRLMEISNNISQTITESFSGIDELCNKVRDCLEEAQLMESIRPNISTSLSPIHEDILSEIRHNIESRPTTPKNSSPLELINDLNNTDKNELESVKREDCISTLDDIPSLNLKESVQIKNIDENIDDVGESQETKKSKKHRKKGNWIRKKIVNKIHEIIQKDIEELKSNLMEDEKSTKLLIKKSNNSFDINETKCIKKHTKNCSTQSTIECYEANVKTTEDIWSNDQSLATKCGGFEEFPDFFSKYDKELDAYVKLLVPDVYRKPALTDLYEKLLMQLEMNDSYVCFQKLMSHTKQSTSNTNISYRSSRGSKISIMKDMKKNFSNSLWFSQKYLVRENNSGDGRKIKRKSSSEIKRLKSKESNRSISESRCTKNRRKSSAISLISHSSGSRWSNKKNTKSYRSSSGTTQRRQDSCHMDTNRSVSKGKYMKNGKKSSAISLTNHSSGSELPSKTNTTGFRSLSGTTQGKLDSDYMGSMFKLKVKSELPINHAEKRKLEWLRMKYLHAPIRKLKCLDILDDLTIRDLQPLKSEYPRKDGNGEETNFVKNCYLTKLLQDSTQETWEHLLQPDSENSDNHIKTVNYDHCFTNDKLFHCNEKPTENIKSYSREDMIKLLQPYLFDPLHFGGSVLTVLPVQVHYDVNTQKLTNDYFLKTKVDSTLEEIKSLSHARWITPVKNKNALRNPIVKKVKKKTTGLNEQEPLIIEVAENKLQANKSGKAVSKQLVNITQYQPEIPTNPITRNLKTAVSKSKKCRQEEIQVPKNQIPTNLKSPGQQKSPKQSYFQKNINNIEHKVASILNDRGDNEHSINAVEKEITEMLAVMTRASQRHNKSTSGSPPKIATHDNLEDMREDLDIISNELFDKLEKILEDADISSESKSSITLQSELENTDITRNHLNRHNKHSLRKEVPLIKNKSFSKTKTCLSSLTALRGEKVNEIVHDTNINAPLGDRKLSEKNSNTPTETSPTEEQIIPSSHGDYCKDSPIKPEENKLLKQINIYSHVDKITTEAKSNEVKHEAYLKQIEFRRHLQAVETLEKIITLEDSPDLTEVEDNRTVNFKTPELKEECEDDVFTDSFEEIKDNIKNTTKEGTVNCKGDSKNGSSESDDNSAINDLPGTVNKIIKRVEDIYTELEGIQFEDSFENIPRFLEKKEIINVTSEEFLTPFMKSLKNKRNSPLHDEDPSQKPIDKLYDTEFKKTREEHFARLCHLPLILRTPIVKHVSILEHRAIKVVKDKPSCMKKSEESKPKKKVSFVVGTEEKANQVEICPHHRMKLMRTSSHQFPPIEESQNDSTRCIQQEAYNSTNVDTSINDQNHIENKDHYGNDPFNETEKKEKYCTSNDDVVSIKVRSEDKSCSIQEYSEVSDTRSDSLSQSKSDLFVIEEDQIKVYFDELNEKNTQVIVKNVLSSVNKKAVPVQKEPKIIIFRELSNVAKMFSSLGLLKNCILMSKPVRNNQENIGEIAKYKNADGVTVILLKSLYAMVYILVFTALNLEYTCVYN